VSRPPRRKVRHETIRLRPCRRVNRLGTRMGAAFLRADSGPLEPYR
jgi:hypothetical protein